MGPSPAGRSIRRAAGSRRYATRAGQELVAALPHARGGRIRRGGSREDAATLASELNEQGVFAKLYQADLSKLSEVKMLARKILKDQGGVDVLIHNASVFYSTPFLKTSEAEWDDLFRTNLKAPFFLSQALAPGLKRIIHLADVWGLRPQKNYLAYSLTKAGLIALTEGLAKELGPEVLVTGVCPGLILPPAGWDEGQKKRLARKNLVGRWGRPEDVARMVVFLDRKSVV